MALTVKGHAGNIFLVRLEPGDDVIPALRRAIKECGISTGVIMDMTGSLTGARIQKFLKVGSPSEAPLGVVEIPGPLEASGHGIIGEVSGKGGEFGHSLGKYKLGEAYIHLHANLTSAQETVCGHLMEGSYVRSHADKSHFTVVLADFSGVKLSVVADRSTGIASAVDGAVISGGIFHDLEQVPG